MTSLHIEFSRKAIESLDFSSFLPQMDVHRLAPAQLRQLFGACTISVAGYHQTPAELFVIPAVRRFMRELFKQWPYWLYFCSVNDFALRAMLLCLMEQITVDEGDEDMYCSIEVDGREVCEWLEAALPAMLEVCARARLTPEQIWKRVQDLYDYFGVCPSQGADGDHRSFPE